MPANIIKNFIDDEQASYTVEFVVLVPLLLAALVFSFEFGRALWAYDVMTRDVRAGARYLSRAPASYTSQAEKVAETGSPTGTTLHFPWTNSATFQYGTTTFSSANFNQDGSVITMTANVPVTLSFMSFLNAVTGAALSTSYTLTVTDSARWVGN